MYPCDQKKLDCFIPDGKTKCFIVMPFELKNTPTIVYTVMMMILRNDLVVLLKELRHLISSDTYVANIFAIENQ